MEDQPIVRLTPRLLAPCLREKGQEQEQEQERKKGGEGEGAVARAVAKHETSKLSRIETHR